LDKSVKVATPLRSFNRFLFMGGFFLCLCCRRAMQIVERGKSARKGHQTAIWVPEEPFYEFSSSVPTLS